MESEETAVGGKTGVSIGVFCRSTPTDLTLELGDVGVRE